MYLVKKSSIIKDMIYPFLLNDYLNIEHDYNTKV